MLYELLAGRPPFDGENYIQILYQVLNGEAPPLRELLPDLPQPVADAVHRALSKDPAGRHAEVGDFAEELAPYAAGRVDTRSLRSSARSRTGSGQGPRKPRPADSASWDETLSVLIDQLPPGGDEDALLELLLQRKAARGVGDTDGG